MNKRKSNTQIQYKHPTNLPKTIEKTIFNKNNLKYEENKRKGVLNKKEDIFNIDNKEKDKLIQENLNLIKEIKQKESILSKNMTKIAQLQMKIKTLETEKRKLNKTNSNVNNNMSHKNNSCAICVDTFRTGDRLKKVNCGHMFHAECLDQWFVQNNRCPICNMLLK